MNKAQTKEVHLEVLLSHVSGTCRRETLLKLFDEKPLTSLAQGQICCDACKSNSKNINDQMMDVAKELLTLLVTIKFLGLKGRT